MQARSISDLDWVEVSASPMSSSPSAWEDEVLYFLLVERFSDGHGDGCRDVAGVKVAGTTPMFTTLDAGNAVTNESDAARWRDAGINWVGGGHRGSEPGRGLA